MATQACRPAATPTTRNQNGRARPFDRDKAGENEDLFDERQRVASSPVAWRPVSQQPRIARAVIASGRRPSPMLWKCQSSGVRNLGPQHLYWLDGRRLGQ
jgi:hypothetical protein